jgi:N-succinyldiaminopimelate aminotransferase
MSEFTEVSQSALHRLIYLEGSPFRRYARDIHSVTPALPEIDMTIGAPHHAPPAHAMQAMSTVAKDWSSYPAITGIDPLRQTIASWLTRRYDLDDGFIDETCLTVLNGSREGLFYAAQTAKHLKNSQNISEPYLIAGPNPFYQAYAAAALSAGCNLLLGAGPAGNGMIDLSSLDSETLDRLVAVYVASPANPQGSVMGERRWLKLIELAKKHGFYVFADECYSEIYHDKPPYGILQAAQTLNALDRVVTFNSLSKRSNLPGLRSGFVAGDPQFIQALIAFRNMGGPQQPVPIQKVAIEAWSDEAHVIESRSLYRQKINIAMQHLANMLPMDFPPAGFCLWMPVGGGDVAFAKNLYAETGIKTLPGSYLAWADNPNDNPGHGHIRCALVHDLETTDEAFQRIARYLESHLKQHTI